MIKIAQKEDAIVIAKLAVQMWCEHTVSELEQDFSDLIGSDHAAIFLKYVDGKPVGFAQCQLRTDYVEGTHSSPVGYLEGIFIEKAYQNCGYAKELLVECEKWAKEKKCTEFASDCELDNEDSLHFHLAMGFEEANRIICFRKEIV